MSRYVEVRSNVLDDWAADLDVIANNVGGEDDVFTAEKCAEILSEIAADMRRLTRD